MDTLKEKKLSKQNRELKFRLTHQARELKIEACLEKVRAIAMVMKKPADMLKICKTISQQLKQLGVKEIRNVQTAIFYEDKKTYMNYEYYAKHNETIITDVSYTDHKIHRKFAVQMLKGKGEFYITHIKGKKKITDWIAYQKTTNVFIDKYLKTASSLSYYWYSLGPVALGISTYVSLSEIETGLFKRFLKVFELAYRRYLDIEKAEAQAYEARIEASLERVRAQAMGIRKSDELAAVGEIIFKELKSLGFTDIRNTEIIINKDEKNTIRSYYYSDYGVTGIIDVDTTTHPTVKHWMEELKKTSDSFAAVHISEKEMKEWRKYRESLGYLPDAKLNKVKTVEYYSYSIGLGALSVSSFKPVSNELIKTLERFKNVFGLAYRRYADVAQAEAQARESQIQLALERVRARTMAMHSSNEFAEVAALLFEQVKYLGIETYASGFNIWDNEHKNLVSWMSNPVGGLNPPFEMPIHSYDQHERIYQSWKNHESFKEDDLIGDALIKHYQFLRSFPLLDAAFSRSEQAGIKTPDRQVHNNAYFSNGYLLFITLQPCPEAHDIFKRFAKVFEQTYTRFLDLQKAEAQAREARIEAALERVRSRTMAMHQTSELQEVIHSVHKELLNLDLSIDGGSFVVINEDVGPELRCWGSGGTANTSEEVQVPHFNMPFCTNLVKGIKNGPGFFTEEFSQKEKKKYFTKLFEHKPWSDLNNEQKKEILSSSGGYTRSVAVSKHTSIFIINHKGRKFTEAENDILKRFAKVFEQTYTRFLDLQKAEAQAREAQIEAALERVRSRSMAMQKSSELKEVIQIVYDQFVHLKINVEHTGFIIDYKERDDMHIWLADQHLVPSEVTVPYFDCPPNNSIKEAKEKGQDFFKYLLTFEEKNKFYRDLFKLIPDVPEETLEYYLTCPGLAGSGVLLDNVGLYIENFSGKPYTDEENKILMRFGKVFQQTYTRFLDLQKAEAQAREAKIEVALERARTQSMLMQHSKELDDTLRVFHEQVLLLGIKSAFSFLWLPDEEKDRHIFWAAWAENNSKVFNSKAINYPLDRNEPATAQCLIDWKSNEPVVSYRVPPDGVESYFAAWSELIAGVEQLQPQYFNDGLCYVEAFIKYGCFGIMGKNELHEDEKKILNRFAVEFERTYTRFLDLQKAEAQARESQIEAALERVRSRSMAMHKSDELLEVINVISGQLQHLNIKFGFVSFGFVTQDLGFDFWLASPGFPYPERIQAPYIDNPIPNTVIEAQKNGVNFFTNTFSSEDNNQWLQVLFENNKTSKILGTSKDILLSSPGFARSAMILKNIYIFIGNYVPKSYSDEQNEIIRRFGNVFEQSYTRFLDLQKAEAQAREAQIEAALERVRSRTMAMQKSDELAETAAVMFNQLIHLGIAPNRLYIGIIKDESGDIEAWATDEDGSRVSKQFTLNIRNASVRKIYDGWKDQEKSITIDMQGKELENYLHYLHDELNVPFRQGLTQKRRVQNIAYFGKGFIGIASPEEQPEETSHLLERFAAVFNLTYTRFNDLKIAEAHAEQAEHDLIAIKEAKQKAEETLTELQATQKQLIQSEKMASLGELTAGIAHEIQNPLNFVNNFSEVSKELLDEMREAMEKGDTEDVKEIMNDVIQNLEKINHHGKRADAIVKGMLQHSRTSSGQKELTDINALCDEYLRLAYHGLRAKDKSFNAKFETDFDSSLPKINVVPQDIGRVVLNLINNAFYAASQPSKGGLSDSDSRKIPTVWVSTKKQDGKVLISVRDNGPGIPPNIRDKIFQPFFTTKPTGQGTGLGLSLSYDIVKAHGGELKVETKEGAGAEFIIQLNIQ